MKTAFTLLVTVSLTAASAFAAPLERGFESGTFTDEYFGVRYTLDGLEAVEVEAPSVVRLFRGRTSGGLEVELSVSERSQGADHVDWLAQARTTWDRVVPKRVEVEEGRSPHAWTVFVDPDSKSGSRQDGFAFYTQDRFAFTVHAWVPAKTDTSGAAIRGALAALEVEPAPDAFLLVHQLTLGGGDPRSAKVLAKAASVYLRDGPRQDFELAYDAAGAAKRAGKKTLEPGELWQIDYLLGHAQLKTGRIDGAADTWKRCIELAESTNDPVSAGATSHYNLAATYALLGKARKAFKELDVALEMEGGAGRTRLREGALADEDFASLRSDARWKQRFGAP
jgi:hypothetical protein